jgi:hypothetical protein
LIVCGVFLALQVMLFLTAGKEGNRGGGHYRPPLFIWIFWRRRVNPSATNGVVRGADTPPLFLNHKSYIEFSSIVPYAFL